MTEQGKRCKDCILLGMDNTCGQGKREPSWFAPSCFMSEADAEEYTKMWEEEVRRQSK